MRTHLLSLLALFAVAAVGTGCEPTCKTTCKKLLECEEVETPRLPLDECTNTCLTTQSLYEDTWEDLQKRDAFADMKTCIVEEECGAIADGVCYDEDLFIW